MQLRLFVLPCLAIAGMAIGALTVAKTNRIPVAAAPIAAPARSPYNGQISASGIVEAASENLAIGAPASGIITAVHVKVGQQVKKDDILFTIDPREASASVKLAEANLLKAKAEFQKLKMSPRPEQIPPAKAKVAQFEASLNEAQIRLSTAESIKDPRAISREELARRKAQTAAAKAALETAKAELKLLLAGAWKADLDIAKSAIDQAKAQLEQAKTRLNIRSVRAPIDGQVLAINGRIGEFAQAGVLNKPLMIVGSTTILHARASIDEYDAWRFNQSSPATAYLRGNPKQNTTLRFVRIEPYVVPKTSLTGSPNERVDTRVMQVIYAFDAKSLNINVGQQVDIYIQSESRSN